MTAPDRPGELHEVVDRLTGGQPDDAAVVLDAAGVLVYLLLALAILVGGGAIAGSLL